MSLAQALLARVARSARRAAAARVAVSSAPRTCRVRADDVRRRGRSRRFKHATSFEERRPPRGGGGDAPAYDPNANRDLALPGESSRGSRQFVAWLVQAFGCFLAHARWTGARRPAPRARPTRGRPPAEAHTLPPNAYLAERSYRLESAANINIDVLQRVDDTGDVLERASSRPAVEIGGRRRPVPFRAPAPRVPTRGQARARGGRHAAEGVAGSGATSSSLPARPHERAPRRVSRRRALVAAKFRISARLGGRPAYGRSRAWLLRRARRLVHMARRLPRRPGDAAHRRQVGVHRGSLAKLPRRLALARHLDSASSSARPCACASASAGEPAEPRAVAASASPWRRIQPWSRAAAGALRRRGGEPRAAQVRR